MDADFLSFMRPWYPPFLANYTHLLQGREGFGFEAPVVRGGSLWKRAKMFSYVPESAFIASPLGKLLLWLPYSKYVALVEAASDYVSPSVLQPAADALYYLFTAPGYMVLVLKNLVYILAKYLFYSARNIAQIFV